MVSPCRVPPVANGVYYLHHVKLQIADSINHGEAIHLQCAPGFQSRGSHSSRCWFGNWTAHATPECVPAPCVLPVITNGDYTGGYRAGLTISHGSFIQYDCKAEFLKGTQVPPRCIESKLLPEPPHCMREDLLDGTDSSSLEEIGADEMSEDSDESTEQKGALDENEEKNMIKKMLDEDEAMGQILAANYRIKSRKWCENPEKLENVLKYPFDDSSASAMDSSLPLISVAEINEETEEKERSPNDLSGQSSTATTWPSASVTSADLTTSSSFIESTSLAAHLLANSSQSSHEPSGQTAKKGVHPPGTEILFRFVESTRKQIISVDNTFPV